VKPNREKVLGQQVSFLMCLYGVLACALLRCWQEAEQGTTAS